MAPAQGFEPRPFESESNVLPLHQVGILAGTVGVEPTNTGSKPAVLPVTLRPYNDKALFCIALPTKLFTLCVKSDLNQSYIHYIYDCCMCLYLFSIYIIIYFFIKIKQYDFYASNNFSSCIPDLL